MRRAEPGALRSTSSLRSGRRPFSSLRGKTHLKEQPPGKQPFSPGRQKGTQGMGEVQFRTSHSFQVCQATGNLDSS